MQLHKAQAMARKIATMDDIVQSIHSTPTDNCYFIKAPNRGKYVATKII